MGCAWTGDTGGVVWLESAATEAKRSRVGGQRLQRSALGVGRAWPVGDDETGGGAERRDICLRWLRDTED